MGQPRAAGHVAGSLPLPPSPSAGEVVQEHLRSQVAELLRLDPDVRSDQPEAVHEMRVASRRLRSALATYRPLLDTGRTDPARDELRWLAGILGGVRDVDVIHARLRAAADTVPVELLLGPVLVRVDREMSARRRAAREDLLAALDDPRHLRLLEELSELAREPPFTERAGGEAAPELARLTAKAVRRVRRSAETAAEAVGDGRDVLLLHAVRKDAKRARYAAEVAVPVVGRRAARAARRMKRLQGVLGEHQDSLVARETLRGLGVAAHLAGENGFTFGLLHGLEEGRGDAARDRYPEVLAAALRSRVKE